MNRVAFTIDIDWAGDEVCQYALDLFRHHDIKCTIFATHDSVVLKNLDKNLFELGIHPNFLPLLQGNAATKSIENTLQNLLDIFPDAKGVRSHSLVQSGGMFDDFKKIGLEYSSNQYLAYWDNIKPYKLWNGLIEVPFNWCDDGHFLYNFPFSNSMLSLKAPLNIFCFHPIHIFLNTHEQLLYEQARPYFRDSKQLRELRNKKSLGVYDLLLSLINSVNTLGLQTFKMSEIIESHY